MVVFQCTAGTPEAQEGLLNAKWLASDPTALLSQPELQS